MKYGKPPTYRTQWPVYAQQWDRMQIKPSAKLSVAGFVYRAMAGKDKYLHLQRRVAATHNNNGVPWWWCAITAERESTQNWSRSLAQGDRWDHTSVNEPAGRGPFKSWEDAAVDALHLDHADDIPEWRLERALFMWERFNGWGYYLYHDKMPSPYVWGQSTIQVRGKYVRDKKWDSREWDEQLGCATMLRGLMSADPSIKIERED
jgi:lysozyme family protein